MAALAIIGLLVLLVGVMYASRSRNTALVAMVWAIAVCGLVRNIFSPRLLMMNDPTQRALEMDALAANNPWVWVTRALYLFVIVSAITLVAIRFTRGNSGGAYGKTVWIAVLLYALGPAMASVFGEMPGVYPDVFLFPLVATAFFMNGDFNLNFFLKNVKIIILLFTYGSLVSIVVNPLWAFQFPYTTGIFPIPVRLFGIAESPQRLGPMLLLYFVAERLVPTRSAWRYLNWAAFTLVMVLMQEKVTILTFLFLALLFSIPTLLAQLRRRPHLTLWAGYGLLAVMGVFLLELSLGSRAFGFLTEKSKDIGLDTLTGRTEIWRVTLDTWRESPFFGYGPRLWDEAFRMKAGAQFMHVGMAHDQYIQSLGETGLMGFTCLIATLFLWIRYAMRYIARTQWVSLGLVSIPFFCAVTEAPFRNYFLGEDFFTLICILAIMIQFPRMNEVQPISEPDGGSGDHSLQAREA